MELKNVWVCVCEENPPVHQSHYRIKLAFPRQPRILKKSRFSANLMTASEMCGAPTMSDMLTDVLAESSRTSNNSNYYVLI